MRCLILSTICLFIYIGSFAQFGGGSGTESDPYRIYTVAHLEEVGDSLNNNNNLYNKHLRLMNDIVDDSLTNMLGNTYGVGFCGSLHGGNHSIALNMTNNIYGNTYSSLFGQVGYTGYIDSLIVVGKISAANISGFCVNNYGTIFKCVCKIRLNNNDFVGFAGIVLGNYGNINSCVNYTHSARLEGGGICYRMWDESRITSCINYGNLKSTGAIVAGICAWIDCSYSSCIISDCVNYGEISVATDYYDFEDYNSCGGIVGAYFGGNENANVKIAKCQNYGTINLDRTYCIGGIAGYLQGVVSLEQCSNYAEIKGRHNIGGIVGCYLGNDSVWTTGNNYVYPKGRIINCYNSGHIHGDSIVGGIAGTFASHCGDTIANCLNTGRVEGAAIYSGYYAFDGYENFDFWGDSVYFDHNYYDAQMLAYNADNEEGMYEWKLTSQLTGDTPELRAILGDGWSYAEGRYPIPLGLEDDSLAMLFATPIYLYAENEEEYDDVDSVQHHFTVGTKNNVSWASGSRLNIVGENATILASGNENVTASLAGYSFSRRLNLINPVIVEEQDLDDVKIFPNPATDILNLTSPEAISEIEILNVMGQVVKRIEVNSDNAVCDVEDLKAGVYFVRIYGNSRTSTTLSERKFVKE
ncbi:MAG: T9SS type A sorting domain-containing protein [Bacteroidales bacterium]|nr:T9SS type A sorting domain-containing protein [Bacteroidales bacterium]